MDDGTVGGLGRRRGCLTFVGRWGEFPASAAARRTLCWANVPAYFELLGLILPVFALIAIGAGLRRVGWLTPEADASLLKVVVNFLYPCLIFRNVLGNEALRDPANVAMAPMLGFVTMAGGIMVAFWAGRAAGLSIGHGLRTFAFAVGIYNYGYIPLPLMEGLFGKESVGVLLVYNVGCEAAIWTVGILVLSGLSLREGWRKLVSPPVISMAVALTLNATGEAHGVPTWVTGVIARCADCAIPLGLLLIGATLQGYLGKPKQLWHSKIAAGACALRLGCLPVAFLALAKVLPISPDLQRVLLVQAAMPAGILPIVIAGHYGGQPLMAVRVVLATTVLGLAVIPLWLQLGMVWLAP